ncbi:ParA family protein [Brevibacillus laterosporus]|uniref:ParA family protein n=1 Tax=Brevibacillus halotolerans TaxID=1507437 RepID=A0ABT4I4Q4_9BACL|nr:MULTISPECIES: ParA family protein [Brevibacillus]MCR8987696.1 ParA family protein [Brevibacillus laterosporus]MCZ0833435.1 ParA family protein [Brevibacillus halotolerans]
MAIVYSVCMNKGGVGKTSLITNLAAALASRMPDKKVLIIDTDGQGNSSIAFGKNPQEFDSSMYGVFVGDLSFDDCTVQIQDNLFLVPANDDMNFLEFDVLSNLKKYPEPFALLSNAIKDVNDKYDYIFIDTPPSLGLVACNVLSVANEILIPFVPELFAVQGLMRVMDAINEFKEKTNPNLKISGVIGMMVDARTTLHSEMLQSARQYCFKNNIHIFDTIIPRSIRFANATAYENKPAVLIDKNNPIVSNYFKLLEEITNG